MKTNRKLVLEWRNNLDFDIKFYYWSLYKKNNFTPSGSPEELTGREVEKIWESKFGLASKAINETKEKEYKSQYIPKKLRRPQITNGGTAHYIGTNGKIETTPDENDETFFHDFVNTIPVENLHKLARIILDKMTVGEYKKFITEYNNKL